MDVQNDSGRLHRRFGAALLTLGLVVCTSAVAHAKDTTTEPYPGVTYIHRTTASQKIHVLKIDLTRKTIRVRATESADRQRTASSFANLIGCEIAVNGDFFSYEDYSTSGLAVGSWDQWPDTSDTTGSSYVGFGVDNRVTIPAVSKTGAPPSWLSDAVGGHPLIVKNGQRISHDCGGFCGRHPRTAAGFSEDKSTLILAVVDGRSAVAAGMTMNELGDLMVEMGAHRALNLDGGGSSTMFVRGEGGVVNSPSDGSQRVTGNHLAVCIVKPRGDLTGYIREGDIYDTEASVAGATVTLSSGETTTTDATGRYRFDDVSAGDVTITATSGELVGSRSVYVAAADLTWGSIAVTVAPPVDAMPPMSMPDAGQSGEVDPDAGIPPTGADAGGTPLDGDVSAGCQAAPGSAPSPGFAVLMLAAVVILWRNREGARR